MIKKYGKKIFSMFFAGAFCMFGILPVSAIEPTENIKLLDVGEDDLTDIELSSYDLYVKPGGQVTLSAVIQPTTITGTVRWSRTAVSGLNLEKHGNTVIIHVADDMPTNQSFVVYASYGEFSKGCNIHII